MSNPANALKTSETDLLAMMSVMPQAVTDDMVLSFKYNISTRFGTSAADAPEYAHEKIQANIKLSEVTSHIGIWDMNKKITYTITINPKTTIIKIDPAMVDWIPQTGGSTTL